MSTRDANVGYIAAVVIGLLIVSDAVYGATLRRESLLSWQQVLMGSLGVFILFGHRINEFVLGPNGVTIKQQIAAAAALGAAEASRPDPASPDGDSQIGQTQLIADAVSEAARKRDFAGKSILWVDDRPMNNVYERRGMEALGAKFTLSTSTEDAVEKLKNTRFDLVISDMGRPGDKRAAYTLLDSMKKLGKHPPFVVYAGASAPEHKLEIKQRGGWGATNRPQELFALARSAIEDAPKH